MDIRRRVRHSWSGSSLMDRSSNIERITREHVEKSLSKLNIALIEGG